MTSDRVRHAVILVVLAVWVIAVGAYLVTGKLPDAPLLGVPGAVYLALYPPRFGAGGRDEQTSPREPVNPPATPPPPGATRAEETP